MSALEVVNDKNLEVKIYSNIAQCYINLGLFEDAIDYCDRALDID